MSHMSNNKNTELVIPSERIFIKLSNGAKMMELGHAQPKLLDTEHARGRKLQTEKIAFEVRGHASTFLQVLTGHFLPSIRHSCLLCQLCLEHCFKTVRMRL